MKPEAKSKPQTPWGCLKNVRETKRKKQKPSINNKNPIRRNRRKKIGGRVINSNTPWGR